MHGKALLCLLVQRLQYLENKQQQACHVLTQFFCLQNTAGTAGVAGVSVRTAGTGGPGVPLSNVFGADWETGASPAQPLDVIVTSDDGSTVSLAPQHTPPPQNKSFDCRRSSSAPVTFTSQSLLSWPVRVMPCIVP